MSTRPKGSPAEPEATSARGLQRWIGSVLARAVVFSSRHPALVLAAAALGTVLCAALCVGRLGVNGDTDAMLSNELPHRVVEIEYHELFPVLYENILVAIDGPTPELAAEGARALAARMEAEPEVFRSVFHPTGAFFEEHALLYLDTEQIEDFGDRLARIQPYLAGLAQDGSLRGLAELMARGVRSVEEGEFDGAVFFPVLERVGDAVRANLEGRSEPFSWAEVAADRELTPDESQQLILMQPVLDFSDLAPARQGITRARELAAELGLDEDHGFRVRMTGDTALAFEEMTLVESQAAAAGLASFVLVSVILWLALRSPRMVLATMLTLAVGLIWTAGFAAVAIGHLNLVSVAFAVLFIGLAVDFGLHFCLRYRELCAAGEEHEEALRATASGVGGSLALCALTTAIGFYAFVPTDFAGVAELGLIAGTGMFISLVHSFTLLPALLSVGRRRGPSQRVLSQVRLPTFPLRHPVRVSLAAALLGAAGLLVLPQVRFDQNPLRVRDPSAESVQILQELLARGRATPWELNAIAPDLESAEALAERLSRLDGVADAITVVDYIPEDQEEKLRLIEDVSLFLPPLDPDAAEVEVAPQEQLAALRELARALGRFEERTDEPGWRDAARTFRADLEVLLEVAAREPDPGVRLERLEESLLGSLPVQLRTLERALSPEAPVTYETLPLGLRERMVSAEGPVRVRIFPSEDLSDNAALARFVVGVREVTGDVAGGAINILEASRAVVRALQQALLSAVLVIALLLLLIWRTFRDTALVLLPLSLAAVLTAASTVLLGIPFNFADVIVLPLLLGIGVDSGIHLVHRARLAGAAPERILETSTARAVVFSAATTIASFGSLGFASHRGMASLGQLLTVGVALTVLANLVFLPALLSWRHRAGGGRGRRGARAAA